MSETTRQTSLLHHLPSLKLRNLRPEFDSKRPELRSLRAVRNGLTVGSPHLCQFQSHQFASSPPPNRSFLRISWFSACFFEKIIAFIRETH